MNSVTVIMTMPEAAGHIIQACSQKIGPKNKIHILAKKCEERGIRYRVVLELRASVPEKFKVKLGDTAFEKVHDTTRHCLSSSACPACPNFLSCTVSNIRRMGCIHGNNIGSPVYEFFVQYPRKYNTACTILSVPEGIACPAPREANRLCCPVCAEKNLRDRVVHSFQKNYSKNISSFSDRLKKLLEQTCWDQWARPVMGLSGGAMHNHWYVVADSWYCDDTVNKGGT